MKGRERGLVLARILGGFGGYRRGWVEKVAMWGGVCRKHVALCCLKEATFAI